MKKIAFSGTLDPITNGHLWVIGEARALAEQVVVFLSENPFKKPQFTVQQRKEIIEQSAAERGWHNIQVIVVKGDFTARAAKKYGIDYLIRGIRNTADFDYENLIQQTNVDVLHGAKTLFVMPPRDLGSVSSSFIKALQGPVGWHWITAQFVPPPAYRAWILDWLRKDWEALWPAATPESVALSNRWFEYLTGPASYGGPTRHYHNLDHLVHGLSELRVWAANTGATPEDLAVVKKAFWFHDAVYGHTGSDLSNEEESAQLWLTSQLDPQQALAVADLIRATDHFQACTVDHPLKQVMLGADLAILGQDPGTYAAYAKAIRLEYAFVPDDVYREHRATAMRQLRDKALAGLLFGDSYFGAQYTDSAVRNLTLEIDGLVAVA